MGEFALSLSKRIINDELYGKIYLTKVEDELSKTREFMRLYEIVQLGTARYIYRSAGHTRASHCFGTIYLIDRLVRWLAERLERKYGVVIKNSDLQSFRIAALLHDLGHGPFSHSLESVLERNPNFRPEVKTLDGKKQAIRHEDFTIDLLLNQSSEVSQVLTRYNINCEEIALLVSGEYKDRLRYFGQLLSSDVDVDRIDYVLRDMHHIGMKWKEIIDINSLIYAFDTDFSPYYDSYILYINESQVADVDLFLHLRSIFIFTIPLNRKVHCTDFMLTRALEHALAKEDNPRQKVYEIFTKMYDANLLDYLRTSNEYSKKLLEKLEKEDFYNSFEFKIRNMEPESRYNFFKLSKEFSLHRDFENNIKELLINRSTLDKRTLGEFDLIVDFNFPEAFPLKLFVRTNLGDYQLYFDYSPLIRGIAKNMFEESAVLVFYDNEIVGKYLELMSNVIIEDMPKKTLSKLSRLHDTDRILMFFSIIDDLGRQYFKIDDVEWHGPFLKGWRRLNDIILLLKEKGVDFSYKFAFIAGKTRYDEEMWRDLLRLVACGLIYERLTPAVIARETGRIYGERNDFQLTPFGRRCFTKYLKQNTEWLGKVQKLIKEEWERTKSELEIIRCKQRAEECIEHVVKEGLNDEERLKTQRTLQELKKEIRDKKKDILLMIDYREDIF